MEELGDALKWIMAIHAKELEDVIHDRANLDYDAELERASALRDERQTVPGGTSLAAETNAT